MGGVKGTKLSFSFSFLLLLIGGLLLSECIGRTNRKIMDIVVMMKKHLSMEQYFLRSHEFVTFRRLQAECIRKGISIRGYIHLCNALRLIMDEEGDEPVIYELDDLITVHEIIRLEKGLSKSKIRARMCMDIGNYARFFKKSQLTTSMKRIEDMSTSLEMTIPQFLDRVSLYMKERNEETEESTSE